MLSAWTDRSPIVTNERTRLMQAAQVSLVLDVGANEGQYATALRTSGYGGEIVSFEPIRAAYERLREKARGDPGWQSKNVALGERSERATLHVSANSFSSSLLPITDLCLEAAPNAAYLRSEEVEVETLDSLELPDDASILLKADVQGYEPQVLRGGLRLLRRIALLELELSLVPLYAGQALAYEICAFVRSKGFIPVAVGNPFCHPATGEILSLDAVFARTGHTA
jgi:FkbM family methyltransferase